jgi:hypothetical protein
MIPELDIWRAANLLIRRLGADAELEASRRADLMLDRGDVEGRLVWFRIWRAIAEPQARPAGRLHLTPLDSSWTAPASLGARFVHIAIAEL